LHSGKFDISGSSTSYLLNWDSGRRGVEELKLGDTLGDAWEEEEEESMEQDRFVSNPESTEFFLSADLLSRTE